MDGYEKSLGDIFSGVNNSVFSKIFSMLCETHKNSEKPPDIYHITMVGALISRPDMLPERNDFFYLCNALSEVTESGICISPETIVDFVNRDPAHGGRDYLYESGKTDMVILCNIYNPCCQGMENFKASSERNIDSTERARNTLWHNCIAQSEAKIIMSPTDGKTEIGPYEILSGGSQYVPVVVGWPSYMFKRDYVQAVENTLIPESPLGKGLRYALSYGF